MRAAAAYGADSYWRGFAADGRECEDRRRDEVVTVPDNAVIQRAALVAHARTLAERLIVIARVLRATRLILVVANDCRHLEALPRVGETIVAVCASAWLSDAAHLASLLRTQQLRLVAAASVAVVRAEACAVPAVVHCLGAIDARTVAAAQCVCHLGVICGG